MTKPLLPLLLSCMLLLASTCHANQEVVAKVIALRNNATATSLAGDIRTLKMKAPIHQGDIIKTGKRGRIQIIFTDNTIISLGRNANLSIHEYLWQPEKKNGALRTEVKEGIFRVMGGAITRTNPEQFTTKTPAATIGIRGSMYAGRVTGDQLYVVFQGGRGIFIENDFGRVEIPTPGYGTNASSTRPPARPSKLSPQEMETFSLSEQAEDSGESSDEQQESTSQSSEDSELLVEQNSTVPEPELPPTNETNPMVDITVAETTVPEETPPPEIPPEEPPTWSPPVTGITGFEGTLTGVITESNGQVITEVENVEILANWHNNTIIGRTWSNEPDSASILFFGTIVDGEVTNITFLGGTGGDMEIATVEGTGAGSFSASASNTGLFSMSGSGSDFLIEPLDQPTTATWVADASLEETITKESDSGITTWQGYSVGVSENMGDINRDRHLTLNADHNDFTLTINRDTGTVSGQMITTDGNVTSTINIGGPGSSAYIHDNLFLALLDGSITNNATGSTDSLKEHGNYLVTSGPDEQIAQYATWGYWETAYQNPGTNEQYHNHVPGALWIAGEPTSSTDLAILASGNVTGQYNGDVMASRIAANGMVDQINGNFQMNVDFANLGAANAFSGFVYLDTLTFATSSNAGTNAGNFSNGSMGGAGYSGTISGTLYGPEALSIGGNFSTSDGSTTYLGIYGGDR